MTPNLETMTWAELRSFQHKQRREKKNATRAAILDLLASHNMSIDDVFNPNTKNK